jgi:hypothetical protein
MGQNTQPTYAWYIGRVDETLSDHEKNTTCVNAER